MKIRYGLLLVTLLPCSSCTLGNAPLTETPTVATIPLAEQGQTVDLSPQAKERLALVADALRQLDNHVLESKEFAPADQAWLSALTTAIGRDSMTAPDPVHPTLLKVFDCRLKVEELNASPADRRTLATSLRVVMTATLDHPIGVKLGELTIPVHNRTIAALLRPSYTALNFKELLTVLEKKGVFEEQVDETTGLIHTAGLAEGENPDMMRQWVTDTVRCGDMQRRLHPLTWPKALMTLAHFYQQPQELRAFHDIIKDPTRYQKGGAKTGVAHIFDPNKLTRDPGWFNNKRLESHGLALGAFCDTMVDGLVKGQPWGFSVDLLEHPDRLKLISETISHLAAYLIAIRYYDAPSAGPWEETPFAGGLTWDTEAARAGLESFADLMENPAYSQNPSITKVREALAHATYARRLARPALAGAIAAGRRKLIDRLVHAKVPFEHPLRPLDASTAFVAGSTLRLAHDLVPDVRRHLEVLDVVQKGLVREHGMLRYAPFKVLLRDGSSRMSPDAYLAKNYWIAFDNEDRLNLPWQHLLSAFGSKDASDVSVFLARAHFATPDSEAQWFLVSEVAYGYAYQASRILSSLYSEKREASTVENELIARAMNSAAAFVNRSLARITDVCDEGHFCAKSNGSNAPPFAVPEAYEFVSTLETAASSRVIAGAHTPLAWARASLYRALMQFHANLERMELGPQPAAGDSSFAH